MSHYRNPYASDSSRYTSQYPYGEGPEHQYLLPDSDATYHRGETLPLHHMDSSATSWDRRISPQKRRVGELHAGNPLERESMLDPGPVKLAPCWEARNASNDELNFRNMMRAPECPPKDRCNAIYLILMLHGIGTLMPWNMFITAYDYFTEYKLKVNGTMDAETEEHRSNFLSYVGLASQIPNVVCSAINLFFNFGEGSLNCRIVTSIIIEAIIFIITIVLAMLDSSTWPGLFFYITMACVVVLNMANGVFQNSVYGTAANLPMKYSNAVVLGSNISGTLTAVISILSIVASPNLRTAAIYYFLAALFVLLMCFDTYFALPLSRFYRYHKRMAKKATISSNARRPPYFAIFKQIWPQCFNVFFIFFVTLALFPAVVGNVKAVDSKFFIEPKYFAVITCFLSFNFFAMIGNIFPNFFLWPGPRFLWLPVVLRALMIPYFMLCNFKPEKRVLPVLIENDWAYIVMVIIMGLTSGYFSSLAMMYAPRCVQPENAPFAGMMAAFFLVLGIFAGINFTFAISYLVETRLF